MPCWIVSNQGWIVCIVPRKSGKSAGILQSGEATWASSAPQRNPWDMGKWTSGLAAAALLVVGCSGTPDQHADSSAGVKSNSADRLARQYETKQTSSPKGAKENFQLVGRWKGELVLPKKEGKPSPEDEFAEAMVKAFLSDLWVEFNEDGTFKMNMMVPIEGKYQKKGSAVHLIPETVMGMSKEDMQKMQGEGASASMSDEPLILEISKDGNSLRAKDENGGEGELVFTRA